MKKKVKLTEKEIDENDSMLIYVLKFNATNPIRYKGKWLPKGTLKKLLDATPIAKSKQRMEEE